VRGWLVKNGEDPSDFTGYLGRGYGCFITDKDWLYLYLWLWDTDDAIRAIKHVIRAIK